MPNHARFYKHPVLQGFESRKAGREIYKDTDFIEIQVPGQKNSIIKRKVQDRDKMEYPVAEIILPDESSKSSKL